MGILSVFSLGLPPAAESGHGRHNAWPYIAACWVVIVVGALAVGWLNKRRASQTAAIVQR